MTLNLPRLRADDGLSAPYPVVGVRARNGRFADHRDYLWGGVLGLSVTNTGRTSSALPGILRKTTTRWRSPYSRVDQERLS